MNKQNPSSLHIHLFVGCRRFLTQDSRKWCQVSDAWCARFSWLGRGQERLGRWHFLEENPMKIGKGSIGSIFKMFPHLRRTFLGWGLGVLAPQEWKREQRSWWTRQIYSCMTDLEGDVLIHIGCINLYEWFCYICMRVPLPKTMTRRYLDRTQEPNFGIPKILKLF